jgi:hypothetical protein
MTLPPRPTLASTTHSNAHATFLVDGDADPAFWTTYFGVEPDIFVVKGKPFRTPSGRMSSALGRAGVWGCRSQPAVQSDTLDPHFEYLFDLLRLPRADLPELLRDRKATMRLLCFWRSDETEPPVIDRRLEEIVKASGGMIDIDQYPTSDIDPEPEPA